MFLIEQILAGICELFTGLDKLPCSAILLARTIHRSSVLREFPAVRCMLTIAEYYHCPIADVCQICISKNILLMPQSNLSAATSDDIRSGSELVKVERIQCLFLFFLLFFFSPQLKWWKWWITLCHCGFISCVCVPSSTDRDSVKAAFMSRSINCSSNREKECGGVLCWMTWQNDRANLLPQLGTKTLKEKHIWAPLCMCCRASLAIH